MWGDRYFGRAGDGGHHQIAAGRGASLHAGGDPARPPLGALIPRGFSLSIIEITAIRSVRPQHPERRWPTTAKQNSSMRFISAQPPARTIIRGNSDCERRNQREGGALCELAGGAEHVAGLTAESRAREKTNERGRDKRDYDHAERGYEGQGEPCDRKGEREGCNSITCRGAPGGDGHAVVTSLRQGSH